MCTFIGNLPFFISSFTSGTTIWEQFWPLLPWTYICVIYWPKRRLHYLKLPPSFRCAGHFTGQKRFGFWGFKSWIWIRNPLKENYGIWILDFESFFKLDDFGILDLNPFQKDFGQPLIIIDIICTYMCMYIYVQCNTSSVSLKWNEWLPSLSIVKKLVITRWLFSISYTYTSCENI